MQKYKTALLTSFGSALEYYDFVIYATLSYYISLNFFPESSSVAAQLKTITIFAIGYLARPFSALVFGRLGDRRGRKKTFMLSILLMSFSTLGIGLLPGYVHLGITSSLLLCLFRIGQGLSQGAEIPGAITFVSEHADPKERGYLCGIVFFGVAIGASFATFISYVLSASLETQQMESWGWRIPFLFGSSLAIIAYFARRHTTETPYFKQEKVTKTHGSLLHLFKEHWLAMLIGFAVVIQTACMILFNLYLPHYLKRHFHYEASTVFLFTTIGLLSSAFMMPLFGWLSDKLGRKPLLLLATTLTLLLLHTFFLKLNTGSTTYLFLFVMAYNTLIAMSSTCYPPMLAELFPTPVRYTGIAITYNVAYIAAAFFPALISYVLSITHHPSDIAKLFLIPGVITFAGALANRDLTGRALKGVT